MRTMNCLNVAIRKSFKYSKMVPMGINLAPVITCDFELGVFDEARTTNWSSTYYSLGVSGVSGVPGMLGLLGSLDYSANNISYEHPKSKI